MDAIIQKIIKEIPIPPERNYILFLAQEFRQNLLLEAGLDNGDYDRWKDGKLEFGNLRKYANEVSFLLKRHLEEKEIFLSEEELQFLGNEIKSFTINQNII